MTDPQRPARPDDGDPSPFPTASSLVPLLFGIARRAGQLGVSAGSLVGTRVEDAVAAYVRGRVERTAATGEPVDRGDVIDALGGTRSTIERLGRAGAGRLARRATRARSFASRSPIGLALRYGPEAVSRLTADVRSVDAAAGFVLWRAAQAGVVPDPDRVATVVVQALAEVPVDPDAPAAVGALARRWLVALGRHLSPLRGDDDRGRRVADTLASLDLHRLR